MEILFFAIILGVIPAFIAQGKGRSFFPWWIYGTLLFVVALIHSLVMNPDAAGVERRQIESGMKKCRYCAEMIKVDAKVCRYCGHDLDEKPNPTSAPSD